MRSWTTALWLASVALPVRAEPPVLHEYVPDVDPDEAAVTIGSIGSAEDPRAEGEDTLASTSPPSTEAGPPWVATPGDGTRAEEPGRRSPSFRPDRDTSLEGTLDYYETFDPTIAPFKRVTSLDRVVLASDGSTPVLVVGETTRHALRVEGETAPAPDLRARDRFWGRAWVDFSEGLAVPLPSVAPESRILSLAAEPAAALRVERDGADNHFLVAEATPRGVVEVTWLSDAPRAYFGAEVPLAPVTSLAHELQPVPASVRARALVFASELGIGPGDDLRTVLHALAAHFRSFEESEVPPHDTGDVYLDLARGRKGICRHRAYAFVVTAQALGIPARFVQNEAHAWAEVKLPTSGWLRVDLGGAAQGLSAHGASDRETYAPAYPDTLPRPPAYEASYSQLAGDVRGIWRADPAEHEGRWVAPGTPAHGVAPGDATHAAGAAAAQTDTRKPLHLSVARASLSLLRGAALTVKGRVSELADAGEPARGGVRGLRVELSLAAEGRRERLLLGVTESGAGGVFRASLRVPPDLAVGDYRLVAVTPGNAAYLPARAE